MDAPHRILRERFGFDGFRPGQEQVIDALLAGRSAVAIFPTGSGKSLCYQLPALLLPGLTLVVSPLIALMKDQIDALQRRGIAAERLDSSLDEERYRAVTRAIRDGAVKLLFVAPERLSNERFLSLIAGQRLSLLAIDEAHCISAWGHNFRPDYLKLARAARELRVERVLALTATATPRVAADMAEAFGIAEEDVVNTGFHRPELELRVTGCRDEERRDLLIRRLREREPGATIVYVTLQRQAEELAAALNAAGFRARPYHAGLAAERRAQTQDAFMQGELPIICATIAFGMGVDKADIRYVYHYHLAKGFESYQQEIGRAGRDGARAVCELFACGDDCTVLENFVYGDTPDPEQVRALLEELAAMGAEIDLATADLARRFDIRPLVIATLLTRLELAGQIRSEGHYYGSIRFAPERSSAAILAQYPERQAAFLRQVLACSSPARKWFTLDIDAAVQRSGQARAVVLRALEDLQARGLIQLQLAGYRQRFRLLPERLDVEGQLRALTAGFAEHERREIERIHGMLAYAGHDGCLTARLLEHFGEHVERCGHCGICLGDEPATPSPRRSVAFEAVDLDGFESLLAEHPQALGSPRQQARFLCGLSSPAVSAQRGLRRHPLFGRCEQVPFIEVFSARGGRDLAAAGGGSSEHGG